MILPQTEEEDEDDSEEESGMSWDELEEQAKKGLHGDIDWRYQVPLSMLSLPHCIYDTHTHTHTHTHTLGLTIY